MTDKDAITEAELRAMIAHVDPVPELLGDAARAAFSWRTIDEELAELTRDSAEEGAQVAVRGARGRRQLSFETPGLGIELEIVATAERERRLEGQLLPPAPALVRVERPDADGPSVQADELGRFVLDGLRAGVVRLHLRLDATRIAIPWTTI